MPGKTIQLTKPMFAVALAADRTNATRYGGALAGVHFDAAPGNRLRLTATDGSALARVTTMIEVDLGFAPFTLDVEARKAIQQCLKGANPLPVEITPPCADEERYMTAQGVISAEFSKLDQSYPPVNQVIPRNARECGLGVGGIGLKVEYILLAAKILKLAGCKDAIKLQFGDVLEAARLSYEATDGTLTEVIIMPFRIDKRPDQN